MSTPDSKSSPKPPFFTASCSLLIGTIFMLVMITVAYLSWYNKDWQAFWEKQNRQPQQILEITPKYDLGKMLKDIKDHTTLVLAPGKYVGNFQVQNRKGIILKSQILESGEMAILETSNGIALEWTECTDCQIQRIQFQTSDPKTPALSFIQSSNVQLNAIKVIGPSLGLWIRLDSKKIELKDSVIQAGIKVQKCEDVMFHDNQIQGNSEDAAIFAEEVTYLELVNNKIQAGLGMILKKINAHTPKQPNLLAQNTIQSTKEALLIDTSSHFQLLQNTYTTKQGPALRIVNSHQIELGRPSQINKIETQEGTALFISQSSGIVIQEIWCRNQDAKQFAVVLQSCESIQLIRNRIIGYPEYLEDGRMNDLKGGGLSVQKTTDTVLVDNEIYDSQRSGISIQGKSQIILRRNQIHDNWGNGLTAQESQVQIEAGNKIIRNRGKGISMQDSEGQIIQSEITENQDNGIDLDNSSPTIQRNKITMNAGHGIALRQNSLPNLQQNEIIQNQGFGIWFGHPKRMEWRQNTFDRNGQGYSNDTTLPAPTQQPTQPENASASPLPNSGTTAKPEAKDTGENKATSASVSQPSSKPQPPSQPSSKPQPLPIDPVEAFDQIGKEPHK